MAKKAHSTRQKMTFRVPASRPRNPLVVPALQRVAGAHRKSSSAERAAKARELDQALASEIDADQDE
jgi:hypothetical protein